MWCDDFTGNDGGIMTQREVGGVKGNRSDVGQGSCSWFREEVL